MWGWLSHGRIFHWRSRLHRTQNGHRVSKALRVSRRGTSRRYDRFRSVQICSDHSVLHASRSFFGIRMDARGSVAAHADGRPARMELELWGGKQGNQRHLPRGGMGAIHGRRWRQEPREERGRGRRFRRRQIKADDFRGFGC
jgi:hypothetical protein